MRGHSKGAHLPAKRPEKPLKDCKEGSARVSLSVSRITWLAVTTQLEKGKKGSKKTCQKTIVIVEVKDDPAGNKASERRKGYQNSNINMLIKYKIKTRQMLGCIKKEARMWIRS